VKTRRNDPCPCGSGLKYKKCCLGDGDKKPGDLETHYLKTYGIRLKKSRDIEGIRRAGKIILEIFDALEGVLRPGTETEAVDTLVREMTMLRGAVSAPLHYRGFPKSVCVSINDVICHGIPGERALRDGDIVNVDVTPILNGYYADASRTFFVGTPSDEARTIVGVARESLKRGMAAARPGNTVGDIGWAIQRYAEGEGCSVVREFVGHGVGFDFHEPPQIPHYGRQGDGIRLIPGMVFTVEPMINLGRKDLRILEDNWTAVTADGSLSAQFEQTILITEEGNESLTPFEL